MNSGWFARGRPESGGFLLPGGRRGVDLLLRADGAYVILGRLGISLEWQAYPDGWTTNIVAYYRGPIGVGITIHDGAPNVVNAMRKRSVAWWLRMIPLIVTEPDTVAVGGFHSSASDLAALSALCTLLAQRQECRTRLRDPIRMKQLAADLSRGPRTARRTPDGVRRKTTEVLIAMKGLELIHHHDGRPLPCKTLPPLEPTVEAIRRRIAASPYAKGITISNAYITRVVNRYYFDVEPWPFAALTC